MNARLLIDAIIQQTTVLIAQLSTAAGLRSPLAHVADQVFLSLAQEIERQGVSRKVVADMFGMALRSYQRKVQRLEESGSETGKTLWEAVLEYVTAQGPVKRSDIGRQFVDDDELAVSSVLADLVSTGFAYASGRGDRAVYGVTSDADRRALSDDDAVEVLAVLVWGTVFRSPGISTAEILAGTRADAGEVRAALDRLLADGRVSRDSDTDDAPLRSASFVISETEAQGWEAAVFDHYQALANAVAAKVRARSAGGVGAENIGGTTFHFGIHPGHPYEQRVLGALQQVRELLDALWKEVSEHNRAYPTPDESATRVTIYCGQYVTAPTEQRSSALVRPPSGGPQ